MDTEIVFDAVTKRFGPTLAVDRLTATVRPRRGTALLIGLAGPGPRLLHRTGRLGHGRPPAVLRHRDRCCSRRGHAGRITSRPPSAERWPVDRDLLPAALRAVGPPRLLRRRRARVGPGGHRCEPRAHGGRCWPPGPVRTAAREP